MGYSADSIDVSGPIVITADKVVPFFEHIIAQPPDEFTGPRWSWTQDFVTYEQTPEGLLRLLTDYGFYGEVDDDDQSVQLECWGGEELGTTSDDVWETLAKFARDDVRWIFVGEDGCTWADCIEGGEHGTRDVTYHVEE